VRLLYNVPVRLSANGAKQNRFALQGISSSSIMFAVICVDELEDALLCMAPYAGPEYSFGSWKIGSTGSSTQGNGIGLAGLGCMLRMPWFGCFICPFAVAGLGFRYLVTPFAVILGHPLR
jgi:hypothetical protein